MIWPLVKVRVEHGVFIGLWVYAIAVSNVSWYSGLERSTWWKHDNKFRREFRSQKWINHKVVGPLSVHQVLWFHLTCTVISARSPVWCWNGTPTIHYPTNPQPDCWVCMLSQNRIEPDWSLVRGLEVYEWNLCSIPEFRGWCNPFEKRNEFQIELEKRQIVQKMPLGHWPCVCWSALKWSSLIFWDEEAIRIGFRNPMPPTSALGASMWDPKHVFISFNTLIASFYDLWTIFDGVKCIFGSL